MYPRYSTAGALAKAKAPCSFSPSFGLKRRPLLAIRMSQRSGTGDRFRTRDRPAIGRHDRGGRWLARSRWRPDDERRPRVRAPGKSQPLSALLSLWSMRYEIRDRLQRARQKPHFKFRASVKEHH